MRRDLYHRIQRVLPLVYDDSLSYYELISKITAAIQDMAGEIDKTQELVENLQDNIQEVVEQYLDDHDIYNIVMQNLDLYFADVRDFYADPTGEQDSTTAFSQALAAKPVVIVPPGTYKVNNLVIPSNKTIFGYGGAEIVCDDLADNKPNAMRNNNSTSSTGYDGDVNITIDGLSFSCPALQYATLLAFGHCSRITIKNCRFHHWNGWHAIEFCGAADSIVENCTFDNYGNTSGVYSECVQLDYMHQAETFPWFGPYNDCDCQNIKIVNNTFKGLTTIRDNTSNPNNYLYAAIGSHTPRPNFIRNILIDNNYIENFVNGMDFCDLYDSTISNNIIKGCKIGLLLNDYIVNNNIIDNNISGIATSVNHPDEWRGIAVYRRNTGQECHDNYINNNSIFDFTYGITYQGYNSLISNNYCMRCRLAGIMCGIKENSNQYLNNKCSSSTGDATHKTFTINIQNGDGITAAGSLLIANNIADYCYIDAPTITGGDTIVRDNQFNGGFTYGQNGTTKVYMYHNLVAGKYNGGLRVFSGNVVNLEAQKWQTLADVPLTRGGIYLVTISATTTYANSLLSVHAYSNHGSNTGSIMTGSLVSGYTASATCLIKLTDVDDVLHTRVWLSTEGTISNWRVEVIDLALSTM